MTSFSEYTGYVLAGYLALTVFFYMLAMIVPKAGFVARALGSYMALLISACFGVFISIVFRLVGYGQNAQWATARCFKYTMLLFTGITFTVEDPKNILGTQRPAVFVANHQTELDVLMLGCVFPKYCSMTAKASLKHTPFLGWFMRLSGAIFLDRKNSKDARQVMSGAADEMKNKRQSVYLFPEGTRSYSKEPMLLPYKKGAFHLAVQGQVPIVPIVVANYSHVLWLKGLWFTSGKIPIKILDPISTVGLTTADVDELTRTTQELMLKELVQLTEQARGHSAQPSTVRHTNGVARASGIEAKVAA